MKYLMILLVILSLSVVSCNKQVICDAAKAGATTFSTKLATKWSCDQTKLYNFVLAPVQNSICSTQNSNTLTSQGIWDETVCPLVINSVTTLGAAQIASQFNCDVAKVTEDLKNVSGLCKLLSI